MNKRTAFILLVFAGIFVFVLYLARENKGIRQVCFQDDCFRVELARTPEQRERGLMFRATLAPEKGMLFIFEKAGEHSFWMKNCYIPLDIIWLNDDREIVYISKNAPPCPTSDNCPLINPGQPVRYVLEIGGGMADKIGLKPGVLARFE